MNLLLLATGRTLPASVVEDARREFGGDSTMVVDVVTWLHPAAESLAEATGACIVVGPEPRVRVGGTATSSGGHAGPVTAASPSAPSRSPWVRALRRPVGKARRRITRLIRRVIVGGVSRQFWARVRRHPEASDVAARADIIVAMDTGAIRTGWHLARRHPEAIVTLGIAAAARELEQRA